MNKESEPYYCCKPYAGDGCFDYLRSICISATDCKYKSKSTQPKIQIEEKCKYQLPCGWCELKGKVCSNV